MIFDKYGLNINQTTVWRILKIRKIRYTTEYKRWVKEKPKLYCLNTLGLELQDDSAINVFIKLMKNVLFRLQCT